METKCVLVFTSLSGNTKLMADSIAEGVKQAGCVVDIKEMYNTDVSELNSYNHILLGSSTWGDGELPGEALDFFEDMDKLNLRGKTAAVFGSGDSSYDVFCAAVDLLEHKLRELGADLVLEGMRIEMSPNKQEIEECRDFGKLFIEQSAFYDK